ncbi:hypothetical protein, partial [Accumulibacter sp.]|uniref:hypothetical protein n=1 Tax=Accumulibacter sp. TaxID=2053492 RepID=UPI00258FAFC0
MEHEIGGAVGAAITRSEDLPIGLNAYRLDVFRGASCKTRPAGLIFSRPEAKAEDAGGHFWHDEIIETNIITPAK